MYTYIIIYHKRVKFVNKNMLMGNKNVTFLGLHKKNTQTAQNRCNLCVIFSSLYTKPRSGYLCGILPWRRSWTGGFYVHCMETAFGCADNSTLICNSIKLVP